MAKEIDKIIQSKTAPKSNNVLWDNSENLKIYRNGKWENVNKQGSSNQELYAYPVEYYEEPEREFKVVELGGEKLYVYLGEISIPSDMEEVEGTLPGDTIPTEYTFQPIHKGVLQEWFDLEIDERYFNLYVGNDKYGYTSLKIEPSEDPNNLKWFETSLGMWQEGPSRIGFAYSNLTLYYRAAYVVPCNIKVYTLRKAQKLDINLIPQEIARKEDIATEINNYEYPTVTIDANTKTYSGQLGSKYINVDANIASSQYSGRLNKNFHLAGKDNGSYRYENDYGGIIFNENNTILDFYLLNPILTFSTYDLKDLDYKNCVFSAGSCRLLYGNTYYPATIDSDDFVTTLINGKYLKYKLNRETHLLDILQEIDLSSIESRIAALESKITG